jgi:adenylate kinase family enzyme
VIGGPFLARIKRVIALVGLPGSGKTEVGGALAKSGYHYEPEIAEKVISQGFVAGENADSRFDSEIMEKEFARDHELLESPHTTFVIETWHPGNLAYALARGAPIFQGYKARFQRSLETFDVKCLVLDIGPALSFERWTQLPDDTKKIKSTSVSIDFLKKVHDSIGYVLRELNLQAIFIDGSAPLDRVRHNVLTVIRELRFLSVARKGLP